MEVIAKRRFAIQFLPKQWDDQHSLNHTADLLCHFRLYSLQSTPDAFASTYEKELDFAPDIWVKRVQNPDAVHLVATLAEGLENTTFQKEETVNTTGWLGILVVIMKRGTKGQPATASPWSYNKSQLSTMSGHPEVGEVMEDAEYYQLNGMFVHPAVRRCGLGHLLIREALAYVKIKTAERKLPWSRVDVLVDSWNIAAKGLYQRCGFEVVGEDTYDVGGSKRTALSMSLTITADT